MVTDLGSFPAQGLVGARAVDVEALTVAMAVAPGVYSRNRFFSLYKAPEVQRAKARASFVRSVVQHLVLLKESEADPGAWVRVERTGGRVQLLYRVPALHFERRTELTELETACVSCLADRAGLRIFPPNPGDREALHAALYRLAGGELAAFLR